jgi:hypothetical protein
MICLTILFLISVAIYQKLNGNSGTWSKTPPNIILMDSPQYSSFHQVKKKRSGSNDSKGEVECRRVLESLFHLPFDKARPDFLNNPVTGGNNLELDCFNEQLKLAVEYDGEQHAKFIPFFHKNKETFYNQKYRDYMKIQLCKDNGITLIKVPHTVKTEDIEKYLIQKLNHYL